MSRLSVFATRHHSRILRLKWVLGRSHREITNTLAVCLGTITQVVMRGERAKITSWSDVESIVPVAAKSRAAMS